MNKLTVFLLSIVVVSLFAGLAFAVPFCGSTCPSQCAAAGAVCTAEEQQGAAVTVSGRELTCLKTQNVGCGFKLAWPFIQENECSAGFNHDSEVDGPVDCGFLGLGAILGGSVKQCHVGQQVSCAVNASCPAGYSVKASSQCTSQQSGQVSQLQCCSIGSDDVSRTNVSGDDELDSNVTDYGEVTQIQIAPPFAVVPLGGQVQFTAIGLTPAGLAVELAEDVLWNIENQLLGNLSQSGLFTACANCTGGITMVTAIHGPFRSSVTLTVVQVTDYRVEPNNVTIADGGLVLFNATAFNLATSRRQEITSTWQTNGGQILRPLAGQQSGVALFSGVGVGNGSIRATSGVFSANATFNIVSATGFQPSQLFIYPNPPFMLSEGEQLEFYVFSRDANGVYGPTGTISIDVIDPIIVQVVSGSTAIRAIARGTTTLNVSTSNGAYLLVPVEVSGCNPGTSLYCSASDASYSAALGNQTKTCSADRTWSTCSDIDVCDNTPSPQPNSVPDNVVCSDWCINPNVVDGDCACSGDSSRFCVDTVSHCWGSMRCGEVVPNRYSYCTPSPSCTGQLFSGAPVATGTRLFNGFVCASVQAVPLPLTLAAVSSCQAVGQNEVRSSITGDSCTRVKVVNLTYVSESSKPIGWVSISRSGLPGVNYTLGEVQPGSVMLNITDMGTGQSAEVLLPAIGTSVDFNAHVTLQAVYMNATFNPTTGESTSEKAQFEFEYDDCIFNYQNG